jgi:DNA mismatch endonuclease (patch repair protein)
MMDRISKQRRSANMAAIRSQNTAPELSVAAALKRMRISFRTHANELPGRPDFILARRRLAVLVHGCFWHRHRNCRFAYIPKSRTDFWMAKFAENIERDRRVRQALKRDGWRVIEVWECQTGEPAQLDRRLKRAIRDRAKRTKSP